MNTNGRSTKYLFCSGKSPGSPRTHQGYLASSMASKCHYLSNSIVVSMYVCKRACVCVHARVCLRLTAKPGGQEQSSFATFTCVPQLLLHFSVSIENFKHDYLFCVCTNFKQIDIGRMFLITAM